jgi:hypothetical protein
VGVLQWPLLYGFVEGGSMYVLPQQRKKHVIMVLDNLYGTFSGAAFVTPNTPLYL